MRMKSGKFMPVDPAFVNYKRDPAGKERIVLDTGEVVPGVIARNPAEAEGHGYISHFATCRERERKI